MLCTKTGPYTMQTTKQHEHQRGIYWFANLLCNGVVIGTIEQMGNGGADRVEIFDNDNKVSWMAHCANVGGQEQATYALLVAEEGAVQA